MLYNSKHIFQESDSQWAEYKKVEKWEEEEERKKKGYQHLEREYKNDLTSVIPDIFPNLFLISLVNLIFPLHSL